MQLLVRDCGCRGGRWAIRATTSHHQDPPPNASFNPFQAQNAPARDQTSWAVGAGVLLLLLGVSAWPWALPQEKRPPRLPAAAAAGLGRGGAKGLRPSASSCCSRLLSPCAPYAPVVRRGVEGVRGCGDLMSLGSDHTDRFHAIRPPYSLTCRDGRGAREAAEELPDHFAACVAAVCVCA